MKQSATILVFVFVSLTVFSQRNISLEFAPLSLIDDVSFPTIQAGINYRFSNRISLYNEFGIKYRRSMYDKGWDSSFVNSKGFKIKTELHYYFEKNPFSIFRKNNFQDKTSNPYLAFNFFYTYDVHNSGVYYYYKGDSTRELTDVFVVKKKVYGFNLLIGKQKYFGGHFGIDGYIGLGMRFRHAKTNYKEFEYGLDTWLTPIDLTVQTIFTEAEIRWKNSVTGNFSCGLRLCYKL